MRRLFIMRKDLSMSAGKLASQVGHCAEAYWTNLIRDKQDPPQNVIDEYLNGLFIKTVCEARNKNHLLKAKEKALELGLIEGKDFGIIQDACFTELAPEENDGTTITGIWFKPLSDEIAKSISKKYQLYK